MTQLSLFDYEPKPKEPKCYSCIHAVKRGHFRLCNAGEMGYKHIGEVVKCKKYMRDIEDE